ncbi:lysosomal protein NCU-G1 [Elysia marginata]|uniref:Lysosomal protein NCU-G1 n=1 Tax=Elysia marginata TaxID=1093978 RepID=A0AAV4IQC8_9GAST|nr:lysosomal protein NCU-G1 [Elysia marginata]
MLTRLLKELQGKPKSFLVIGLGIHDNFDAELMKNSFFKPLAKTYKNLRHSTKMNSDQSLNKDNIIPEWQSGFEIGLRSSKAAHLQPAERVDAQLSETFKNKPRNSEDSETKTLDAFPGLVQKEVLLPNVGVQSSVLEEDNEHGAKLSFENGNKNKTNSLSQKGLDQKSTHRDKNEIEKEGRFLHHDFSKTRLSASMISEDILDNSLSPAHVLRHRQNSNNSKYHSLKLISNFYLATQRPGTKHLKLGQNILRRKETKKTNNKRNQQEKNYFSHSNDLLGNSLDMKPYHQHETQQRTPGDAEVLEKSFSDSKTTRSNKSKILRRRFQQENAPSRDVKVHRMATGENLYYQKTSHRNNTNTLANKSKESLDQTRPDHDVITIQKLQPNQSSSEKSRLYQVDSRSHDKNLSTHDKNLLTADKSLSTTDKNLSTHDKNLSTADKNFSTANKNLSTADKNLSTADKNFSTADKNLSTSNTNSNQTVNLLPHLFWMGIHAPGLLKSSHFEAQSAEGVQRFNNAIEKILDEEGIPYLDTFNFTSNVLSFDGTHYGFAINMLKANMFLTYIRESFAPDADRR